MRRLLLSLSLALSMLSAPALAQKSYVREDLQNSGVRLEEHFKKTYSAQAQGRSAQELRQLGITTMVRDPRRATVVFATATTVDPKLAGAWLGLAQALMKMEPANSGERYRIRDQATTAGYLAYQLTTSRAEEAQALALIGEAYAKDEVWRQALNAYRASLERGDMAEVRSAYQALREKHGFRVREEEAYKVDSDAANPRICIRFTEQLQRGKVDFAPFVSVSGASNISVAAEDQQLCVDGLKHGERYTVTVRQGLPSDVQEQLLKTSSYDIYVRDRSPQVRFPGKTYVLPRVGQEGIPVLSVNAGKVYISVGRIGDRSLLPTLRSDNFLSQINGEALKKILTESGFKVWSGMMDTRVEQNRDVVTAFPVLEAVGKLEPGVYVMTASATPPPADSDDDTDNDYDSRATQWFVVSDLGLTALSTREGISVFARSLASARALGGLDLKLVARNNEVLATVKTDSNGHAQFDPGLARGEGGLAPGMLVASGADGDYNFLDLEQTPFDLADRGVKGRAASGPVDAFLFAERGVYRSGETVYLTALARDAAGNALSGLPLTFVAKRPDGVEYRRAVVADAGQGGRSWSLPLTSGAARGTWRVQVFADPKAKPAGETTFLVEDYVPERLSLALKSKLDSLAAGQPAEIEVQADYLYGAPGSGLEVTGEVSVKLADGATVPGLKGWVTGLDDEAFESTQGDIEEGGTTDAKGKLTLSVPVAEQTAPRPLEAKITLRVGESGGRATERSITVPIRPAGPLLAAKKMFRDEALVEGGTAEVELLAVTPEGARLARAGAQWTLSRIDRRYQWLRTDGSWTFEAIKSARRLASGTLDIGAAGPARLAVPVEMGQYRLEVRAEGVAPVSVGFSVGWLGEGTATTPDLLETQLDKAAYKPGDTLKVKLNPRFAGSATVAVVTSKVQETHLIEVPKEGASIEIPVKADWGTGGYLVAFAHRPLDKAAQRAPGRSLGLAWFGVDSEGRKLKVEVGTQETMRPRGTLAIPVKLSGLTAGEEAFVSVAAVDVGILNLTRYKLPDPTEHYFGQRQLAGEVRDLYGHLIDGLQGTRGAIRSGGDGSEAKLDGAPPAQAPLTRYSGVVKVGADGTATVSFDIPAFNGTARVMVAAWSKSGVGQAEKDVVIRDPVVVAGTLPRFLNFGDSSRFFVEINNVEGAGGDYTLDLDVKGPVLVAAEATRKVVPLQKGGKTALIIPVKAGGLGTATLDLRMTGPQVDVTQSFNLTVLPGTQEVFQRTVRTLQPQQSVTLTPDMLGEFLPGTGMASVSVSNYGGIDLPALLAALDRYPYGCTEQTVSRALPLLYVNRLAKSEMLAIDPDVEPRIQAAIDKVMTRQGSSGAFGLWSVEGAEDIWLDSFVADFLTRARERKFAVPQKAFDLTLDRLKNYVSNATDVKDDGADLAYAIYVLARNGRPVMNDLKYLADTKLEEFTTPLGRAQLAAALALLGDRARAASVFGSATEQLQGAKARKEGRGDYGSILRDGAGLMALAAEASLGGATVQKAAAVVTQARGEARYTSTQENAWMVLAAEAMASEAQGTALTINGQPHSGALHRSYLSRTLEAGAVTLTNTGMAPVQMVTSVSGHPLAPEGALASGFKVERTLHKLSGEKIEGTTFKQNDRMVVVLKVTELEAKFGRLLLVDLLPAGLEIDNPALVEGGSLQGFSWLKRDVEVANSEYRDDRFVAAFNRRADKTAEYSVAYVVRAVAPGDYVHPPAVIEDMYQPQRFGRTAYGRITVTPAR